MARIRGHGGPGQGSWWPVAGVMVGQGQGHCGPWQGSWWPRAEVIVAQGRCMVRCVGGEKMNRSVISYKARS